MVAEGLGVLVIGMMSHDPLTLEPDLTKNSIFMACEG